MREDDSEQRAALPAAGDAGAEPETSDPRFGAIIDATPVPMALNDEEQRITFLNSAFVRTFGYTQEDIPTLAEWWPKAYPDPDYREWVSNAWQVELARAKRTGTAFTPMEFAVRGKDGTTRTVLASAASLAGSFRGTHLVVLYDISERKSAEAERTRLEAQLHQAQKMESIGRLAGGIAHDFNNVLGVILGHAELALEHLAPSHVAHADICEIRNAAERSANLTRQLRVGGMNCQNPPSRRVRASGGGVEGWPVNPAGRPARWSAARFGGVASSEDTRPRSEDTPPRSARPLGACLTPSRTPAPSARARASVSALWAVPELRGHAPRASG